MSLFRLLTPVLIIFTTSLYAQSSSEIKNIFTQAESYFLYEEFELANPLYVLIENSDNMNLKYKIGACYLNIYGEKEKSIPYLELAVKSASFSAKTENIKEQRAPLDVYFFLAKAYMINEEYEKAINTLQTFSKLVSETGNQSELSNFDYVKNLIAACHNAIKYREAPVIFSRDELWNKQTVGAINENPAVSFDGKSIVFTERRGIENAIFYSRKENEKWDLPVEVTTDLNAGSDCSSCSLNNNGTEMFLYKQDNYDGVIYSSKLVEGKWTPVKKLNKNVNTRFYESHGSVSSDGKRLYFASNREGGYGNLDIYVSEREESGDWGPAINLGPSVNTPFNEDTPFITTNDSLLYFCSEGHNTMGGYDNYKCLKTGSGFESPINLGYPINSSDDDKFFQPANNGKNAFYSFTTDYKKKGIFYLELSDQESNIEANLGKSGDASAIDSNLLIRDLKVSDVGDTTIVESDVLYYTVQVMALYKPIDVSYFKYTNDMKVMYNDSDKFYRYTTGKFDSKAKAYSHRASLIKKGYAGQIFVKKISR